MDISTDPKPAVSRTLSLLERGDTDTALETAVAAASTAPRDPEILHVLGVAFEAAGRPHAAVDAYLRAYMADPTAAGTAVNLGNQLRLLGRGDEAAGIYRKLLRHDPAQPEALYGLSVVSPPDEDDPPDDLLSRYLAQGDVPPDVLAALHFTLGNRHHWRGDAALALDHYRRGNGHLAVPGFDDAVAEDALNALRADFTTGAYELAKGWGRESSRPVFVAGLPRGGKTSVARLLGAHPHVHDAGRRTGLQRAAQQLRDNGGKGELSVSEESIKGLARRFLDDLSETAPEATYVLDCNPDNIRALGLAGLMVPKAPVILVRRSPRDAGLECFATRFVNFRPYSNDLSKLGRHLRRLDGMLDHWAQVLPNPVLQVNYDDVHDAPAETLRRICAFLSLADDNVSVPATGQRIRFDAGTYGDLLSEFDAALAHD